MQGTVSEIYHATIPNITPLKPWFLTSSNIVQTEPIPNLVVAAAIASWIPHK